jgi:hypothetical protein
MLRTLISRSLIGWSVLLGVPCASMAQMAPYQFTPLPQVIDGIELNGATAIDNNGRVLFAESIIHPGEDRVSVVYRAGRVELVPPPGAGGLFIAADINTRGDLVGNFPDLFSRQARVRTRPPFLRVDAPVARGYSSFFLNGINEAGLAVGACSDDNSVRFVPYFYNTNYGEGWARQLPGLEDHAILVDVNDWGVVVGFDSDDFSGFFFDGYRVRRLTIPGAGYVGPATVNNLNQIVGGFTDIDADQSMGVNYVHGFVREYGGAVMIVDYLPSWSPTVEAEVPGHGRVTFTFESSPGSRVVGINDHSEILVVAQGDYSAVVDGNPLFLRRERAAIGRRPGR